MASRSRRGKTVYERIAETKKEIQETEQRLADLNLRLQNENHEKDELEMHELFQFIRSNGITLDQAKVLMSK